METDAFREERKVMRKRISNILWGLIFIAVGLGVVGNMAGIWEFHVFFDGWWTLFLIVPAVISLIEKGFQIGNSVCLVIGAALLAACRGVVGWDVLSALFLPAIFIVIGLVLVMRNLFHLGGRKVYVDKEKRRNDSIIFSGKKIIVEDEFFGMDCDAVFGGVVLDLRKAKITENISIDTMAVFGGVDILLPAGLKVVVSDTSLFGGCNNQYHSYSGDGIPTVYINATALFGGVEVR